VVDSPDDNLLAEFTSIVDGVNCAVEIQRELAERNADKNCKFICNRNFINSKNLLMEVNDEKS
jgi:hypothetical protein